MGLKPTLARFAAGPEAAAAKHRRLVAGCFPAAGWVLIHEGPGQGWRRKSPNLC